MVQPNKSFSSTIEQSGREPFFKRPHCEDQSNQWNFTLKLLAELLQFEHRLFTSICLKQMLNLKTPPQAQVLTFK